MIYFTVPGKAVPAVRMTQKGKFKKEAQRYLAYKFEVGLEANKHFKAPLEGKIAVNIQFVFNDKRRRDIDNLIKSILDGMNGIAYKDDSQVYSVIAAKDTFPVTEKERTLVTVYPIGLL